MAPENGTAIPIDAHPEPVVAYVQGDEEIRVRSTNDAFEARFGSVSTNRGIEAIFEQFDVVRTPDDKAPATHMIRGNSVEIYLDGADETEAYCARVIPTDSNAEYLVFSRMDDCLQTGNRADVGHVTTVISHDLRNPLDVAKAHLLAARETGNAEHFDAVSEAHDRMERIIRDVLTLARGSNGVDSEQIALETVIDEAWQSVDTDGATLARSGHLPEATADRNRIQRLFENLFRNAIEHGVTGRRPHADDTPDQGSEPSRSTSESEEEDRSASAPGEITISVGPLENGFYVADDGSGVAVDARDDLFEPGYTNASGGTGLGLAIVDRIVTAHDWNLRLTSSQDGGARFEVRFS